MRRAAAAVSVTLALLAPARASAEPKDACISAYEQTQTLRKDGKLVAARAQAAVCAHDECPELLVKDCVRWMRELDESTPTVILEAHNEKGEELVVVDVSIDGEPLASRLEGAPVAIDPGKHVFRFSARGATYEERLLVREGEKKKRIVAKLDAPRVEPQGAEARPTPAGVFLFGGASIVALGIAAGFAMDGLAKRADLDECRPRCAPGDVDAMSARFTVADVALGAGVVAAAAAAYLFFTRPAASRARPYAAPGGLGVRF